LVAARWAREHREAAGRFTDTLASAHWWFLPGAAEERCDALIGARLADDATGIPPHRLRLAEAIAQQLAFAIERIRLAADLETARVQSETERLRNALLSSVSHDLRSPLSAMIGAATSLRAYHAELALEKRAELATTVIEEGQRLDRYIQNLLDMTRLGHGAMRLERDWTPVGDLLGAALDRLRRYYPDRVLDLHLEPELPLLYVHPALIEQALFNILENAAGFSPADEPIAVAARTEQGQLLIDISDRGPGIALEERRRIFDMFYSVGRGDRDARGTGLGLSICRGMIGAHGGSVQALDGPEGAGTTIRVTLPLVEPPATCASTLPAAR
jgi:two-component system sensor histidine kinase KdpD